MLRERKSKDSFHGLSPRTPAHFFFPDGIGAGSLFTRHGGFLICLLKVEEGCCSKMKTKSFQHYILTVTHFPLDSGMLKRPYFFNLERQPSSTLGRHLRNPPCLVKSDPAPIPSGKKKCAGVLGVLVFCLFLKVHSSFSCIVVSMLAVSYTHLTLPTICSV